MRRFIDRIGYRRLHERKKKAIRSRKPSLYTDVLLLTQLICILIRTSLMQQHLPMHRPMHCPIRQPFQRPRRSKARCRPSQRTSQLTNLPMQRLTHFPASNLSNNRGVPEQGAVQPARLPNTEIKQPNPTLPNAKIKQPNPNLPDTQTGAVRIASKTRQE